MEKYTHKHTSRLSQLTGDYDPQGLPHMNFTKVWKCIGVDLGANTEFDNATFIYFGDVVTPDSHKSLYNTDLIAFIDHAKLMPGANLSTAQQGVDNQLDVFFIDEHGRLYVSWVEGGGVWQGPVRISPASIAPKGGSVATAHQGGNNQLDVFFIAEDGGLCISWVLGDRVWQGPVRISPAGIAPKGGSVATAYQGGNNQLDVFFIGEDGGLYVSWVVGGGVWQGPVRISPAGIAPKGGIVATAHQGGNNQLDVFFIGEDGGLYVSWVVGGSVWQGPVRISPAGIALKGGSVATAHQGGNNQLDVFFIGEDGGLYVSWVVGGGVWQGPVRISPAGIAPKGSSVATAHQGGNNQLDVFFIGEDGGLYVSWVVDGGVWQGPVRISPAGIAPKGGSVATAHQGGNNQLDVFFIGVDSGLYVSWVVGYGIWQNPVNISQGFKLTPIMQNDHFYPFTYADCNGNHTIPGDGTPTGVFGYDNKMFVFFYHGLPDGKNFSGLSVSTDPFNPKPYQLLFKISTASASKFFQVAPYVIRNSEFSNFLPSNKGDGLIIFGHGGNVKEASNGVHLAWMPLQKGTMPHNKEDIRYYSKNMKPPWTNDEKDATLFFKTEDWSSISVGRIPATGKWILLNQTCGGRGFPSSYNGPIVCRIADTPWGIADSNPINIFDPVRDHALGNYMFKQDMFEPCINHPAFAYGPFLLNHYTEWDQSANILTLHYLMSTGSPYQVQVMQSKISLNVVPWYIKLKDWLIKIFKR